MKKFKKLTALVAVVTAISCLGITTALADDSPVQKLTNANRSTLLGLDDPDSQFLGIASQFSVFVHEDFEVDGSDCEGRLAAGGNANMGNTTPNYSVAAKVDDTEVAHVVVGGDQLRNFQPGGDRNFVIGTAGTIDDDLIQQAINGQDHIYEGQLIDFDKEFAFLESRSKQLAAMENNTTLDIDEAARRVGFDVRIRYTRLDAKETPAADPNITVKGDLT